MAHYHRLARAGLLAGLLLAARLLSLPTSASPPFDDVTSSATASDYAEEATTPSPVSTMADASDPSPSLPPAALTETAPAEPTATSTPEPSQSPTLSETPSAPATGTPIAIDAPSASPDSESPPTATDSPSEPPSASPDSETVPTATASPSETASAGAESATPTLTTTPSQEPASDSSGTPFAPGAVLINEVAWAGTIASTNDEWIELWNPGADPIPLDGWTLTDNGDIVVVLAGQIDAHALYLLERTNDQTVSDVTADGIYTGSLNNGGEALELLDPSGNLIDTANSTGGAWPAGNTTDRASMERHGLLDLAVNWATFPGTDGNGTDAGGNPIAGTPRRPNAPSSPATASPTASGTPSPTPTPGSTAGTPFPLEAVIINEVAWAGTWVSASDEWLELFNPGDQPIDLDGWTLTDDGDIDIGLQGVIDSGAYYLLERSDDQTISDIPAGKVYSGALSNDGERLRLVDPSGADIDSVNPGGGAWPAGDTDRRSSMERANGMWRTFTGYFGLGRDADGHAVRGTPAGPNSVLFPTPTPTWILGRVVINEILIRPHHDWEGAGGVTTADEFIEIYNHGPGAVNLKGWILDDYVVGGSSPYELPSITLEPGGYIALFRSRTHIALNDGGDSIRLSAPDGSLVDKVRYLRVRAYNLSYGRLPDGDDVLVYGLWPTPGKGNVLFVEPSYPAGSVLINEVAWAGTLASANDEWIELWNPGSRSIHLDGWMLTDDNDIHIDLVGSLPPGGYAILERTDEDTISDLPSSGIYHGALSDEGERLRLIDPSGKEIDVVDPGGGGWPAGGGVSRSSMERLHDGWLTFTGGIGRGLDAEGNELHGTPGGPNSALFPTSFFRVPGTLRHLAALARREDPYL